MGDFSSAKDFASLGSEPLLVVLLVVGDFSSTDDFDSLVSAPLSLGAVARLSGFLLSSFATPLTYSLECVPFTGSPPFIRSLTGLARYSSIIVLSTVCLTGLAR